MWTTWTWAVQIPHLTDPLKLESRENQRNPPCLQAQEQQPNTLLRPRPCLEPKRNLKVPSDAEQYKVRAALSGAKTRGEEAERAALCDCLALSPAVCAHQFGIDASYPRAGGGEGEPAAGLMAGLRLRSMGGVFQVCLEEQMPSGQGCGCTCSVSLLILRFQHRYLQGKWEPSMVKGVPNAYVHFALGDLLGNY